MNKVCPDFLVGVKEVAETLHVPAATVQGWINQRRTTGIPEPVARIGAAPIFDMSKMAAWWDAWVPQKKHPKRGYLSPEDRERFAIEPLQEETSQNG